jgi:hypothetical protein
MGKNRGDKGGKKEKGSNRAVPAKGPAAASKKEERAKRATLKKQRVKKRGKATYGVDEFDLQLRTIGCRVNEMEPDGNCLFRSLSDQISGDAIGHRDLRQRIMDYVETNRDDFEPFMEDDESFDDYVERMREDGEWGGNQELCAAARLLNRLIIIHQFQAPRMELAPFSEEDTDGTHHPHTSSPPLLPHLPPPFSAPLLTPHRPSPRLTSRPSSPPTSPLLCTPSHPSPPLTTPHHPSCLATAPPLPTRRNTARLLPG